jgi:sulfur-oxidizing protein SoxY
MNRRCVLAFIGNGLVIALVPLRGNASEPEVAAAIKHVFGERPLRLGRVALKLPKLAESGNSVPINVTVKSVMSPADRVLRACIFANRNPRPLVATVLFGSSAGRAAFSTNIRLNGTQDVVVVAEMSDYSLWVSQARVVVTIGACDALENRY